MDAKVVTAPTEGDWRIYKGWIHPSFDGPSPQTTNADVAICEPLGPDAAINARLIVAACNSYQRHALDPVGAAEGDMLGAAIEALRRYRVEGRSPEADYACDAILSQVREARS